MDLCDDQIDGKVSEEDSVNDVSLPMELADVYEPKVIPNTQYKCEACYEYLSKFSRRPPTHVLCHHFVAAHLDKLVKHQCPENEDGVKWICGSIVSCPTYYEARHREEIAEKKITKKKTNRLTPAINTNQKEVEAKRKQLMERLEQARESSKKLKETPEAPPIKKRENRSEEEENLEPKKKVKIQPKNEKKKPFHQMSKVEIDEELVEVSSEIKQLEVKKSILTMLQQNQ